MQVQVAKWGKEVLTDAVACVRTGHKMIKYSMGRCRAWPLAVYAAGERGCDMQKAQQISADRFALAAWVLTKAEAAQ
jgi:hypothetical protein